VPPIWHLGHKVEIEFRLPEHLPEGIHLPAFWEIKVDRKTIGTIDDDLQKSKKLDELGQIAIERAGL
jgi:hypothetical protein